MIIYLYILVLSLGIGIPKAYAQEVTDDQKRNAEDLSELGGVPAIFRTPESGLGIGTVLIYTHDTSLRKPSPIISGLMYSEKKQLLGAIGSKQNFDDGRYALFGYGEISKFPQQYFGIGNQTRKRDGELYKEQRYSLDLGGEFNVYQALSVGLSAHLRSDTNYGFEEGGMFANHAVQGQDGGHQNGFQAYLYWETTNDNFYPTEGNKITLAYRQYVEAWGSQLPFDGIKIDARDYRLLSAETVIASQLFVQGLNAEPPFYQMGLLGGNDLLRGYFKGRYRDRKLAVLQTELRKSINKAWRFAVFTGAGHVGHDWGDLTMDTLKPSYGAGLRYQITPKQKINLRLDIGIGEPSEGPQVYLYVMEAY